MSAWRLRSLMVVASLAIGLGCAPTQIVPLDLEPATAAIYIDGEPLETPARGQLELRADRPHVLFFKQEGYRSQQLVLESRREGGEHRLQPGRVEIRLAPIAAKGRSLRMELDQ